MKRPRPEPSTPFSFPDEPGEPPPDDRGEALRGVLQIIARGRTASARLLRAEVLAHLLSVGAATVPEIAARCRCTERRVFAVLRELRNFIGYKS